MRSRNPLARVRATSAKSRSDEALITVRLELISVDEFLSKLSDEHLETLLCSTFVRPVQEVFDTVISIFELSERVVLHTYTYHSGNMKMAGSSGEELYDIDEKGCVWQRVEPKKSIFLVQVAVKKAMHFIIAVPEYWYAK